MTTKILALTDALSKLVRFVLLPGNRYDTIGVAPLIEGIDFDALRGDKAFDANWIVEELDQRGAKVVISQRPNRLTALTIDQDMYQWRHLIKTSSANSKSSSASPCAPAKPTGALGL